MDITSTPLNPDPLRAQFPALQQKVNGQTAAYLDGPGGTQVPRGVIKAMDMALTQGISNLAPYFVTGQRSRRLVAEARQAMADLLNARPEEIVFGQNMTSLTFALSHALSRTWQPGEEIVVTRLDHDGNISPWLLAARDAGVTVRWLDFRPENCTLAYEALPDLLNEKTRLVAVTHASNAMGTIIDVGRVVDMAHRVGAQVCVDAVHYGPHGLIDVKETDCDYLSCSAYKFFGPHTGVLYGKYECLDALEAYKLRPAPDKPPRKWESGTQSFESLAGVTAAVDYLAAIGGEEGSRRERLERAMSRIKSYEMGLSERFLRGATDVPGLRVFGITDIEDLGQRAPTFAVRLDGWEPEEVAVRLGEDGLFVWHGHYYAVEVVKRMGLLDSGGFVRIGFVHYNTADEVDRVLAALKVLAAERAT